jgi:hypothetical protein
VNNVNDLRLALSEEVRRLQPPAGLESRVLRQALGTSLAAGPATPAARRNGLRPISQSIETPRLMAIVAVLLALAIVASLVFAARALHLVGFVPAGNGPVGQGQVVTPVDFQCSLPVTVELSPYASVQIELPGGMVSHESIGPANFSFPSTYDVQAGRWVPVARSAISPDGRSWAYGTGMLEGGGRNGTLHVVDAVTGKDMQLWSGTGGAAVLGFLSTGVYFVETGASGPSSTLWVVDPARPGSGRAIGAMPSNASWDASSVFGPLGGFALMHASSGYANAVERMDLSGNVTTWFTNSVGATPTTFLGVDAQGHPIIAMNPAKPLNLPDGSMVYRGAQDEPGRVLLLTGPNQFVVIADGSNISFRPTSAIGDSHGVWFGERGSIWLYQVGTGLREVFAMPPALFPEPPMKKLPPDFPSPPPPTPGAPSGAGLTIIGPCT